MAVVPTLPHGACVRDLRSAAFRRLQREPRQQQDQAGVATEPAAGARDDQRCGKAASRLHALSALGSRAEGGAGAGRDGLTRTQPAFRARQSAGGSPDDRVDLQTRTGGKPRDLHRRARWMHWHEVPTVDLVHGREVAEVGPWPRRSAPRRASRTAK